MQPAMQLENSDDELARVRAELHAHYQRHLGRVDLRAFVEPGPADVPDRPAPSFAVDDLYQPLVALEIDDTGAPTPASRPGRPSLRAVLDDVVSADGGDGTVSLFAAPAPLQAMLERPRTRPVLILGAPGAGKSLFLRWCALAASRDERFLGVERALPVHVSLASVAARSAQGALDLATDALAELRTAGLDLAGALATDPGRVVFLLDGLDEAGDAVATVADAIGALARHYPAARVIVASRPSVLDDVHLDADRLQLEGFEDDAIAALLTRWCELDACRLSGEGARARGQADGARLARKVLASPAVHDLAASPLLATFIAVVHRAGQPLPDHRIELCDRVVELVVARWNQVRAAAGAPPLALAAALRLLGPLALGIIETGRDTISGDDTLVPLRDALGLLVERGPGVQGFVHRTLVELLAAHEVVDTGALERLLAGPACFAAAWHEVIRLALGVVGTRQLADDRLAAAVGIILDRARAARSAPTMLVPQLLGTILIDDPALTPELAAALCDELVPAWWFDGAAACHGEYAGIALADRILNGPWQRELARAFVDRYRPGWGEVRYGARGLRGRLGSLGLLRRLGCSVPLLLCEALVAEMVAALDEPAQVTHPADAPRFTPLALITPPADAPPWSFVGFALHTSGLTALLKRGAGALFFAAMPSESEVVAPWIVLEDSAGTRMIGRRLDAPRDDQPIDISGSLHITVIDRPDPALLPNVLAAWGELAARYPDGPRPPASVADAITRYGSAAAN